MTGTGQKSKYLVIEFKVQDINKVNANIYSLNHPVGRLASIFKDNKHLNVATGVENNEFNKVLADGQEEDFKELQKQGINTQNKLINNATKK